jgi:hypothetical protein
VGGKKDHAWFVSFAPAYKPEISVIVLIENSGFGAANAAPAAKGMYEAYLSKRNPALLENQEVARNNETRRNGDAATGIKARSPRCLFVEGSMVAIIEKRDLKDFDWLTTLLAVAIACFGVWQIHNALPTENYWSKQIIGLFIALAAFAFVAFSDYRRIIDLAPIFYVIGLVLLLLVVTPLGVEVNGQKAWLKLPIVGQFQPSEFVKIPTVLMLAKYFGAKKGGTLTLKEIMIGSAIFAGPIVLIMLEPDAGQAITYFPILATMFLLSGIKIRYVVLAIIAVAIMVPSAYIVGVNTGKIKTLPTGANIGDH